MNSFHYFPVLKERSRKLFVFFMYLFETKLRLASKETNLSIVVTQLTAGFSSISKEIPSTASV